MVSRERLRTKDWGPYETRQENKLSPTYLDGHHPGDGEGTGRSLQGTPEFVRRGTTYNVDPGPDVASTAQEVNSRGFKTFVQGWGSHSRYGINR